MEYHLLLAWISWSFFILTMLIRPLNDVFKLNLCRKGMRYRQYLGIVAGTAALVHVGLFVFALPSPVGFLLTGVWDWQSLFGWGMLALIAILPPLITSNRWSQCYLKTNWKKVQYLSYPAFVLTGVHIAMIDGRWWLGVLPVLVWLFFWWWAWWKINKTPSI